jgi:gentisate 1,2-dioxygenase
MSTVEVSLSRLPSADAAVLKTPATPASKHAKEEAKWCETANIFEYGAAANPVMAPIPVLVHPAILHEQGSTRIIPFDINDCLDIDSPCTSPNLMASFVRVCETESIDTKAVATSQAFYVIRGSGETTGEHGAVSWSEGDLFVVPVTKGALTHTCHSAAKGGAALYWVHDEPLMEYLGVAPAGKKFEPTLFKRERMLAEVEEIAHANRGTEVNRLGVLLGNKACDQTKTLTHVLWSLLNSIPANSVQRPHRHNSVALDLAVAAKPGVYTLMGKEIDTNGDIVDPIRCDWTPGGVFVTPPGWWHSHHNESDEVAWVLPMQDAGLYTHQRTLDIRFVDDELALHRAGRIRGSAFAITNRQYTDMSLIGSQVPVPKVLGMKRVMSVDDTSTRSSGKNTPENSTHGSNQAYHLLHRTPSWPETPPQPPYPQYGAAFQLVQQDGSRRGSSQAYQMLRVAQNAQLKMPNGALANCPSGLPNGSNVPPHARVPVAGNNAGC